MILELGQEVYHADIYWGKEPMKVIGLRLNEVELEGDLSGGTHNVCQSAWFTREGVLESKNEESYTSILSKIS